MKYDLFSSAVVLSVVLLVAGLVVFAPAANDASRLCQSEMGRIRGWACKECKEGWVTATEQAGGLECEHGPEHDVDCRQDGNFDADAECWEQNGHGTNPSDPNPNTGDGVCMCYECKPDNWTMACEGDIRIWYASCGMESQTNCGKCEIETGENGIVRQQADAHVVGGGGCSYGENSDFRVRLFCGRNFGAAYACLSSNCESNGNWNTGDAGQRTKCK